MLPPSLSDRPPDPEKHRRVRWIWGALLVAIAVVVALQYTSYALLPAEKTDTLWGVLVGAGFTVAVVEWHWRDARLKQSSEHAERR